MLENVQNFSEQLVEKNAIPYCAKYAFITGYLESAIANAMDRMTEEERNKFFPTIAKEL